MAQNLIVPKRLTKAFPALKKAVQWLEYFLFRSIFAIMRVLPLPLASRLSAGVFCLLGPLSDKRASVLRNLRTAFPDKSEKEVRRLSRQIFGHFGQAMAELVKMPAIWRDWQRVIEFEVDEASHAHLSSGQSAVFVTAHLGPWQVTPTPITRRYLEQPILMVHTPESNPMISRLMIPMRESMGVELASSKAGLRPLLKALQKGQSLGFAMDTRVQTGQLVPFFGMEALTTVAPARLALKGGMPLIPVRSVRIRPGKFKVVVTEPVRSTMPEASDEEQAADMTRQVNERFTEWISETPEQWICLKRRWPKGNRL